MLNTNLLLAPMMEREDGLGFSYFDYGRLVINGVSERRILKFEDILFLQAESNYTTIHTKEGKVTVSKTLKSFTERINGLFIRVHQSYIVNLMHISSYHLNQKTLDLAGSYKIPVSRSRHKELLKVLH